MPPARPWTRASVRCGSTMGLAPSADQEAAHRIPRDEAMGHFDILVEELLKEFALRGASFVVLARDREDGAVVLHDFRAPRTEPTALGHVAALAAEGHELLHLLREV